MRRIALCALGASLLALPVGAAPLSCEELIPHYQSNNYEAWDQPKKAGLDHKRRSAREE